MTKIPFCGLSTGHSNSFYSGAGFHPFHFGPYYLGRRIIERETGMLLKTLEELETILELSPNATAFSEAFPQHRLDTGVQNSAAGVAPQPPLDSADLPPQADYVQPVQQGSPDLAVHIKPFAIRPVPRHAAFVLPRPSYIEKEQEQPQQPLPPPPSPQQSSNAPAPAPAPSPAQVAIGEGCPSPLLPVVRDALCTPTEAANGICALTWDGTPVILGPVLAARLAGLERSPAGGPVANFDSAVYGGASPPSGAAPEGEAGAPQGVLSVTAAAAIGSGWAAEWRVGGAVTASLVPLVVAGSPPPPSEAAALDPAAAEVTDCAGRSLGIIALTAAAAAPPASAPASGPVVAAVLPAGGGAAGALSVVRARGGAVGDPDATVQWLSNLRVLDAAGRLVGQLFAGSQPGSWSIQARIGPEPPPLHKQQPTETTGPFISILIVSGY